MSGSWSIFGIIVFIADVWAIASVLNSNAERRSKIVWTLIIAILPVVGLILWYLMGPKANYNQPR